MTTVPVVWWVTVAQLPRAQAQEWESCESTGPTVPITGTCHKVTGLEGMGEG